MISTELTRKALAIAERAHEGQVDKCNVSYIHHPIFVAEHMDTEIRTAVALLHDVIEDTYYTEEILNEEGIPREVTSKVRLISRDKGEVYQTYIDSLIASGDRDVLTVKYWDLTHNLDPERMKKCNAPVWKKHRYELAREKVERALSTDISQN